VLQGSFKNDPQILQVFSSALLDIRLVYTSIFSGITLSLDGFMSGQNDDVERLLDWVFDGKTD